MSKEHKFSVYYLQKLTARFYWIIVATTKRSVYDFYFLDGGLDGIKISAVLATVDTYLS